jgi:O-antigen ligase
MLGLLTYLPTILRLPHALFAIALAFALARNYQSIIKLFATPLKIHKTLVIILAIALLSIINMLINVYYNNTNFYFPYPLGLIATFLIAISLKPKDIKIIFWLACFEALIVFIEFALNTDSIIPALSNLNSASSDLLYFNRPLGLSYNSSIAAYKFLAALLIADFINYKGKWIFVAKLVLIVGIFFTFSRTVFVVLAVYYIVKLIIRYKSILSQVLNLKINKKDFGYLIITGLLIIAFISIGILKFNNIKTQFTKGSDNIELSGREVIWPQFAEFIKENPIMGNYSHKYYADYKHIKNKAHAHNSFLQVMADNGIIIFGLYLLLIIININRRNALFISIFVLYSITQYGIFWGISLLDILFLSILMRKYYPNVAFEKSTNLKISTPKTD